MQTTANIDMRNPNIIATLLLFVSHIAQLTTAQTEPTGRSCYESEYRTNSKYGSNLNTALSLITSRINTSIDGFTTINIGENPDKANALVLCRGDVDPVTCSQCVHDSILNLREGCPNRRGAIAWYDFCMLRYSNNPSILTDMDDYSVVVMVKNGKNVTDLDQFNKDLKFLLDDLRVRASAGGKRKFATGNVSTVNFLDIYGLLQCTPNLSKDDCHECLSSLIRAIPDFISGNIGGQMLKASCIMRFDVDPFLQRSHPPPPENHDAMRMVVTTVAMIVIFAFFVVIAIQILISKWEKRELLELLLENADDISTADSLIYDMEVIDVDYISATNSLKYDFETIRTATDNFSESNKLGQGGFGAVYKGTLENGVEIAVKRLSVNSEHGELEFKNEVVLLAKLQHRNLVRLLGFCLQGIERLLIYEFVPNASLDHFIFGPVHKADLDWGRRYKIIGDIARGLLYLHEDSRLRIIHRDLKAGNILLDTELTAKIADFGLAKLFERHDETHGSTTRIAGTIGYMAPEYAVRGQFSVKSDVFSFGVLILEIVTGQRNISFRIGENEEQLLSYAWHSWKEQRCMNLLDPILRPDFSPTHNIMRCIHIALLCVQENADDRPTISSINLMFNSFSITLPVPSKPACFKHNGVFVPQKLHHEEQGRRYHRAGHSVPPPKTKKKKTFLW